MTKCTAPFLFLLLLFTLLQSSSARPKPMTFRLLGYLGADDAQGDYYEYESDVEHDDDRENLSKDDDDDDDDDDELKEKGGEISKAFVERGDISPVRYVMDGLDDVYDDNDSDDYEDDYEGDDESGARIMPFNEYVERGYIYHKAGQVSKGVVDEVGDDDNDVESEEYGDIDHGDYEESKMSHDYYSKDNFINYDEHFDEDDDDYKESNMFHEDSGINGFINDEEYIDDEDVVDDDDDLRNKISSDEEGINSFIDFDEVDFESTKNSFSCFGGWC